MHHVLVLHGLFWRTLENNLAAIDIVKAICMGAAAVLVGRAYAYGLAAAGEGGVAGAISILRADVERTLRLLGCDSVRDLDGSYVDVPANWLES